MKFFFFGQRASMKLNELLSYMKLIFVLELFARRK